MTQMEQKDKIAYLNKKYFSKQKDEVNIMADLGDCAKRLIFILTIEEIMGLAYDVFNPRDIKSVAEKRKDGTIARQTTFNYSDPENYESLSFMHAMMMDGLMISLRNLFYCDSVNNSKSAGSLIMEINNCSDLGDLNEIHRRSNIPFGYSIGFIKNKDIKLGYAVINGDKIYLDKPPTKGNFTILNDDKKYILYCDRDSKRAQQLAKRFVKGNYFDENGERRNNLFDIKEYEKFHFHKDKWPDGKRWKVEVETEYFQGIPVNSNHYESLCKTDMKRVISAMETLVEIMNLYYRSCVALFCSKGMQIPCNVYGSLPKMILDICSLFSIDKQDGLHNVISKKVYELIPNTINAMMLSK